MTDLPPPPGKNNGNGKMALIAGAIVLVLTWAITTLFEVEFVKALAFVVLALFGVFVLLLLAGIG